MQNSTRPDSKTFIGLLLMGLGLCLGADVAAWEGPGDWENTDRQKLWGLMQIWSAAKYNFVYFDQVPDLDWDAAVQAAIPEVLETKDTDEYYLALRELTALLDDGHTMVLPPGLFTGELDNPPVELQVVEGRILLARVGDTEEIRIHNLRPGLELVEVGDGIPAGKYFDEHVARYFSGGTRQWREAFGMYLLLNGPKNSTVRLKFRDRDTRTEVVELTRSSVNDDGTPFLHRMFAHAPLVEKAVPADGIVYLRLSTFQSGRIVDDFAAELEKLDLDETTGMILDLRFNSGGNSTYAFEIVSRLIDRPVEASRWKTRKYLPAHRAWGREEEWHEGEMATIEPSTGRRYPGPLVILVGPTTLSAAEDFLVPLDHSGRAVLVGDKTGGSTGQPLSVPLPGGGVFKVCAKRDAYPDGREFVGFGIEPDIVVRPTREDLYENRDRALEKAVEVLRNR